MKDSPVVLVRYRHQASLLWLDRFNISCFSCAWLHHIWLYFLYLDSPDYKPQE